MSKKQISFKNLFHSVSNGSLAYLLNSRTKHKNPLTRNSVVVEVLELGHRLRALRHGVFLQLPGQHLLGGPGDVVGRHHRPVAGLHLLLGLGGHQGEHVVDEDVQHVHGFLRDARVGVDLAKHLFRGFFLQFWVFCLVFLN